MIRRCGIGIGILFIVILAPSVDSSLVRFEEGLGYEYSYAANVTLDKVATIHINAKVS